MLRVRLLEEMGAEPQKRVVGDYWMIRQRVVGDLSMTQHTVSLVFREGESPESREEKYWMTRRRLPG
ncbi:hypothetical protein OU733_004757 [Escherichia coli]|nr:hypothetical protein [Escherichia coli]